MTTETPPPEKGTKMLPLELEQEEEEQEGRTLLAQSKKRREHAVPLNTYKDDHDSDVSSTSYMDEEDDDDYSEKDDDDDDEQDDGLPAAGLLLAFLIPFLLLTVALTIAYVGRRQDAFQVAVSEDSGNSELHDNEVLAGPVGKQAHEQHQVEIEGATYNLSDVALEQVKTYRNATGLILNLELAHQGGNAVCHSLGHAVHHPAGSSPGHDCKYNLHHNKTKPIVGYPAYYPWNYEETAANVEFIRRYHHMIAWSFASPPTTATPATITVRRAPLQDTNLEEPHLLTVLVVRDPLDRMLAFDGPAKQKWPAVFGPASKNNKNHDLDAWWSFAKSRYTNNYALNTLVGGHTTRDLQNAKVLLSRVSVILDMACLDDGLQALSKLLQVQRAHLGRPKPHPTPAERIPNEQIAHFLKRKNQHDMELYQWAKTRSLVRCSS